MSTGRAVVLAGGLGKRMRAADPDAQLTAEQKAAADAGLKAMIPVNGRPFLDYILSSLADAGIRSVALVVAPDHEPARRYYVEQSPPERVRLDFVVQPEPRGTANAMLAAESWTDGEPFLSINGDNFYPPGALADLARLGEPGLLAFERDDLIHSSNIPPERIKAFAVIDVAEDGSLRRIIEKPAPVLSPGKASSGTDGRTEGKDVLISMNCWRFDARIFAACRDVPRSVRGEFELPEAVGLAVRRGIRFRALPARGPVLDLSRRADTADVAERLAGTTPRP